LTILYIGPVNNKSCVKNNANNFCAKEQNLGIRIVIFRSILSKRTRTNTSLDGFCGV